MERSRYFVDQLEQIKSGGWSVIQRKIRRLSKLPDRVQGRMISRSEENEVLYEADALTKFINSDDAPPINIVYDTRANPPTLGDALTIMMLARYLAGFDLQVKFTIKNHYNRADWRGLSRMEQDRVVSEWRRLAYNVLPTKVVINTRDREVRASENINDDAEIPGNEHTLFRAACEDGRSICALLPVLLFRELPNRIKRLPGDYLLTLSNWKDAPDVLRNADRPYPPYVAWHVRRHPYQNRRNPSSQHIISDYLTLRSSFPEHLIMIFSTPDGVDFALSSIRERGLLTGAEKEMTIGQPATDFVSAIPWVLGSDHYLQRLGGGLGQVAIFSQVPYVIVTADNGGLPGGKGQKNISWAMADQEYRVDPRTALYKDIKLWSPVGIL